MNKLNIIATLFLLFIFQFISAQDYKDKPLVDYVKLSPDKIKEAFELESSRHKLGRVVRYSFTPSGKLEKETGYDNEKGELKFFFEYGYTYNENDSLVSRYKYLESSSSKKGELEETLCFYPSDSLKIVVREQDGRKTDTTYIHIQKDHSGKTVLKSEIRTRLYGNRRGYKEIAITRYSYNKKGQLTEKRVTDKTDGSIKLYKYRYKGNQLKETSYTRKGYQSVIKYKKGLPDTEKNIYPDYKREYKFSYDRNGRQILSKLYEDGKHIYSYKSSYNEKGKKIKYDMVDEYDGNSGIWLFEYDEKGKLAYKIDLYARERKKKPEKAKSKEKKVIDVKDKKSGFVPFKIDRPDGFFMVSVYNTDSTKIKIDEKPILVANDDFKVVRPRVSNWGELTLELSLTEDGIRKLEGIPSGQRIALVVNKKVVLIPIAPLPFNNGKIQVPAGGTLREINRLIKK